MSVVEEIKQRIDIVDLVSQFVPLKRAGRDYVAPCPFHSERTPSFHVSPERQTWHCFGACGTGGDIFSFIMKKDDCEFRDALRVLAERAGVTLESRGGSQDDARRARLYEANEAAAIFFHAQLLQSPQAAGAREYIEGRRVASAAVEKFQFGYAPNSWDALTAFLAGRGFTPAEIVAAGLAIEGDRGAYDRFRHRLMFPIRDDRGRVAGFGGRILPGEALGAGSAQAKYMNTPQSPIFDKGSILYGLDLAKDAIRSEGRAVIVEGYMDVIAAHEHGYASVVASMGTALTERQVALLKRHSSTLILALDSDNAGSEATLRSVYDIVNSNLRRRPVPGALGVVRHEDAPDVDLRVLAMPAGRDPDEVIRDDRELWHELIESALPLLDYVYDAVPARHDLDKPQGRSAVARNLLQWVAVTPDRVVQSHYLQRLARIVQVDEATLRLELRRPAKKRETQVASEMVARQQTAEDRREEFCLALLFRYPVARAEAIGITPDVFSRTENRVLFETWVGWADTGEPFERSLTPDLRPQYERISNLSLPAYDDDTAVRALRSAVWGIEQERLRLAKRVSAAVLQDIASQDAESIAERAHLAWQAGVDDNVHTGDEADPATAFVDDMEAGLKVHQRLLERRSGERPR